MNAQKLLGGRMVELKRGEITLRDKNRLNRLKLKEM